MKGIKPTDFLDIDLDTIVPKLLSKHESSSVWESVVSDMYYDLRAHDEEQAALLDGLVYHPKDVKKIDPLILGKTLVKYVEEVLSRWTNDSSETTSNLMVQSLPLFIEMSKSIPHVNPKDKYKSAFRGTDIRQQQLFPFVKKSKLSDWKRTNIGGTTFMSYVGPLKNGFIYKPHRAVQSWSVSDKAAAGFAGTVIAVPIDNTFFFDPKFTGQFGYDNEKETVHYGKQPMKVLLSINKEDFDDLRSRDRVNEADIDIKESNEIPDEEGTLILPGI